MTSTGQHYLPRLVAELGTDPPVPQRFDLDGALLFVDVSGFTALSEALAGHGRIGAEIITGAITETFTALLTTAGSLGGDLLKFGGDALLLLFRGDDAPRRAAAAAAAMHRDLVRVGRVDTPTGRIELGMSAGIGAGTVRLFLAGDHHLELVAAGEVADAVAAAEGEAQRGETVVDQLAADRLPPGWTDTGEPPRLRHGEPDAERTPWTPAPPLDVTRWIPPALRAYIGEFAEEGEHRSAAVGFARVGGAPDPLAPATVEAMHATVAAVQRHAAAHGVTFLGTDLAAGGFKMVLSSGVPESHPDNEERMLRAALAVLAEGTPLPVAFGVHAGGLFAGDVGAPTRRTYTVMGDTVNLAARLAARAEPGQLLASRAALARARSTFSAVPVTPFRVKGKAQPVEALLVGEASERWRRSRPATRMVGREQDLAVLRRAVVRARTDGVGALVDVVAEPGMGKTRLVEEAIEGAAGLRVEVAACGEYLADTPYAPFRQLLRDLIGIPDDASPGRAGEALARTVAALTPGLVEWLPLLAIPVEAEAQPTPAAERLAPRFRTERLHRAVAELLAALVPEPAMLVIEDVHWMDHASSHLLAHLATTVPARPWVLCVTRRPGGAAPFGEQPAETVALAPLHPGEAATLVSLATGRAGLLPGRAERVVDRSGGNPLFVIELAAGLAAGTGADEFPETLEGVVASRLDALPLDARRVLRRAAVVGREVDPDLLEVAVGPDEPDWSALADFVEPTERGGLRFRHAIIREVAYGGLPYRQRREIHRRVAARLERRPDPPPDLLSLHSFLGGRYVAAWVHSVRAGDRAARAHANDDAARLYHRALETRRHTRGAIPQAEASRVAESLGDVATLAGMYRRALEALTLARRWARHDPARRATVALKRARVHELLGDYRTALRLLTRLLEETEGAADEEVRHTRVEARLTYAGIRFRQGRYRDCARWSREAVERAEQLGRPESLAHGYYLLAHTLSYLEGEERGGYAEQALRIYQEIGDPVGAANVLNNLGVEAYNDGRWDEAVALQERHEAKRLEAGDVVGAAIAAYNRGLVLLEQARLLEADDVFTRVRSTAAAANHGVLTAAVIGCLGSLASRRGDHALASELLGEAARRFADIGSTYFELDVALRAADARLLAGNAGEAMALADAHLPKADGGDGLHQYAVGLRRVKGLALGAEGDRPEGRLLLERAAREAADHGLRYEELLALTALGRVEEAAGLAERLGVVSLPATVNPRR